MKLKEFQKKMREKKIGGALIFYRDPNYIYFVQKKVENSFLLVLAKGKPVLFISKLENLETEFRKIVYEDPYKDLKKAVLKERIKILGINEGITTVRQKKMISKFAKTTDIEELMSCLRETKTKAEIELIENACSLTETLLKGILKNFNFKEEGDVVLHIRKKALELGCDMAFDPKVASGRNAAVPHYEGSQIIKKGFLIIDMGLKYKGYCADITRTFYVGKPSKTEIDTYNRLLKIQEEAIKKVKPGAKTKNIDLFVRKKLGKDSKYFIHSLGHGLGINVHEKPGVGPKADDVLKEGNVITIEPGIYKDFGIRIEDDVLVTAKGCRVLTKFPKGLIIIPKV